MATRRIHNKIAKQFIPNASLKDIDAINRKVDDPDMLHKYGRYHRRHWGHDTNAMAKDSLTITKGDPTLERVRKMHILVDENPTFRRYGKSMEIREEIKRLKRH
jgi:hypothetical protein